MRFGERLSQGSFVARRNLFLVEVEQAGHLVPCFLPNPGRLPELLVPGAPALLNEMPEARATVPPARRTRHDLVAVRYQGHWVSVDTRLPNALFREAHAAGSLPELAHARYVRAEYRHGTSRFDFLLEHHGRPVLVEVKSVTMCEGATALFPDAPTVRGTRHLRELARASRDGLEVYAFFCIQRPDAVVVRPNDAMDRDFGLALREARRAGVGLLAYRCETSARTIRIAAPVPIELPPMPRATGARGAARATGRTDASAAAKPKRRR